MEAPMNQPGVLLMFLPMLFLSVPFGFVAYFLAKDKGRKVGLWTVLGAIPVLNMFCIWYFVGATNLQLEQKIDKLLGVSAKN